jgi:peptidoglycan glycosyltransferase
VTENRNQRLRRARPVLAVAVVAFLAGAVLGSHGGASPELALAEHYVSAWARSDYASMYSQLTGASRRSTSASEFADAYHEALVTATATGVRLVGHAHVIPGGKVELAIRVRTRLFGTLLLPLTLPFSEGAGAGQAGGPHIVWSRSLTFPGLRPDESLSRNTSLPRRAPLLARDGSTLAEAVPGNSSDGPPAEATRGSPLGNYADAVLGNVGAIPTSSRLALEQQGVPANAVVGVSGLELAFDARLRGTPGGTLLAGSRVLAAVAPRPAPPLRTTVSPTLQRTAVTALGGQLGGVIAMQPSTGQVLAVAGLGLDALQPPGSTFKMITTTGVLSAHLANSHTVFPYATSATLDGVKLSNAHGEECGGTLELAFAVSCNSVFSPLGVKLGAARLVATAERLGFNHAPGIAGAAESTLPAADQIQGELDLGSTAIGQGQVLASPLEMATVAATIADSGHRPQPTFLPAAPTLGPSAMSTSVAHTMRRLMIAVVREGTGTSAAIPGVTVAGKTGTAELKDLCESSTATEGATGTANAAHESQHEDCGNEASETANTDAWFAAFAPALDPRIVVCVLLVKDGAGGSTAAPVAREVIEAALQNEK